jgi:hypothetical protein
MALAASMGLEDVACTKLPRRGFSGWSMGHQEVVHSAVGGITTKKEMIVRLRKGSDAVLGAALPFIVGRDASRLLSSPRRKALGDIERHHRRGRSFHWSVEILERPATPSFMGEFHGGVSWGSFMGEFHGGGLLSGVLDRSVQVVTPTVFAKKGYWGIRILSRLELLFARDLDRPSVLVGPVCTKDVRLDSYCSKAFCSVKFFSPINRMSYIST